MDRTEQIRDFKNFINNNREKIQNMAVAIEELPNDDAWIADSIWDEVYWQNMEEQQNS